MIVVDNSDYKKSPVIMAFLVFFSTVAIILVLKLLIGIKNISLEAMIIPFSMLFPMTYGQKYKEELPKSSKIKYAVIIAVLYLLYGILISCFSPVISKLSFFNTLIVGQSLLAVIIGGFVYFISGWVSKRWIKYDFRKIKAIQNAMPKKVQIKRKLIAVCWFIIMALPIIFTHLENKNITKIPSLFWLIGGVIWLVFIFSFTKYLKRNSLFNLENYQDSDSKEDVIPE